MQELPLSEFRANAASVLDQVQQGQTVRILRHGKPVADLVPVRDAETDRLPNWKQAFAPVQLPPGVSLSQAALDQRDDNEASVSAPPGRSEGSGKVTRLAKVPQ